MPDRILRAGILSSEAVNKLTWQAEVFYRRLMSVVDDFGRYDARASILRAALYPLKLDRVSEPDVVKWIDECREAGLVRVYVECSRGYLEVTKFDQRLRAKKSKWPAPSADICGHLTAHARGCGPPSVSDSDSVSDSGIEGPGEREKLADPVLTVANAEDLSQVNLKSLPSHLNTPRMVRQWQIWMNARRAHKKPKNWAVMFNEQIDWLTQFQEPAAFEVLSASIRNGWQGLFEPKNYGNRDSNGGRGAAIAHGENPRNVGVCKGPTDYGDAVRRKLAKEVVGEVAKTPVKPPATSGSGGKSV
jgi:hypothetical protein